MARLPRLTGKQVLAALQRGGWYVVDIEGSHHQLRHPDRPGRVTVTVHGAKTLHPKTLTSILKQANMTVDELTVLL